MSLVPATDEVITTIFGASSTVHNRFLEWGNTGLLENMWKIDPFIFLEPIRKVLDQL